MWLYTDLLQALKGRHLSSVFSTDGTLISASAVPRCGGGTSDGTKTCIEPCTEGKRGGKSNRDSRTDRIQTLMNGQIDRLRKREKERGRQINHGLMQTE